jgi:hypothetical protein
MEVTVLVVVMAEVHRGIMMLDGVVELNRSIEMPGGGLEMKSSVVHSLSAGLG